MLDTELVPAPDKGSRRLMVVLHGLGDSVDGYRWLPQALNLPWLNYRLVNAPDDYYGGFSWYDYLGDATSGVVRSRKLLIDLLDGQRRDGFPADQTVLFGFSQGCLMAVDVALRYPHRLAGVVGISGHVHDLEGTLRELSPVAPQQRFLVTHGLFDPVIPFAPSKQQMRALQEHGLQIEWHEFAKDHTIAGEEELRVIREFVKRSFAEKP
jgi:phospholipase/carboxylesterase